LIAERYFPCHVARLVYLGDCFLNGKIWFGSCMLVWWSTALLSLT
jgi:hypothetical protein